jgi:hypothetical protein
MTTENNKIIAKFMGFEIKNKINYVPSSLPKCMKDAEHLKVNKSENLPFHNDWNWLMEVVEKIRSIDNKAKGNFRTSLLHYQRNNRTIFGLSILEGKEYVYNACLEFIKWYNENSAKEK